MISQKTRSNWGRALLFMALFVPALACAQQDQVIFDDSLQNGWDNWGWADLNYNNSSPTHSGTRSISVNATAWQAIYMHHEPFDSTLYAKLRFWLYGGPNGGQRLQVSAMLNQVAQPQIYLPPLPANQWTMVEIPLANLGVANKTNMDGFWIKDASGVTQATFYVDDVQLVAVPPPPGIQLGVDASQVIRQVDDRFFSLNATAWDGHFGSAATVSRLQDSGLKVFRYPGGSLSDVYHWQTNTSESNTWTWATSFDTFASTVRQAGGNAIVTTNYGTGTAQEAAEWVRYSNVTKGYGFKYWEIGNEVYGAWENDSHSRPHDPWTYAQQAKQYIDQMKAVDPTIKVGIVGMYAEDLYANYTDHPVTNPRTGHVTNGWMPVVLANLKAMGTIPDFVVFHKYVQGPGQEVDFELLQSGNTWTRDVNATRQLLNDYLGSSAANVEIMVTESNSVYSAPGKQSTSLVNGLFLADAMCQAMNTELKGVSWWGLREGKAPGNNNSTALYGWRLYGDYGIISPEGEPYPTYYAYKMLKNLARGGDSLVKSTSDFPTLSIHSAKRADGSLGVMVINKDPISTYSATLNLSGFTPGSGATVYSYGVAQDEAARTTVGSPDVATSTISVGGTTINHQFPPYSITVFSIPSGGAPPPPPPSAPWAPTGLAGTVLSTSRIDLSWTDASNNEDGFRIERSTDGVNYAEIGVVPTNVTTFPASGMVAGKLYYFRVRSYNAVGYSAYSNVLKLRTRKK